MVLTRRELEEIGDAVIRDFTTPRPFSAGGHSSPTSHATQIDTLAKEYLGLNVSYAPLSQDGSICGLTAYADTSYQVIANGSARTISLKRNQVLLDRSLQRPVREVIGRRRFTLAHECAHQILFHLEDDVGRHVCEKQYAARESYSLRDLKTREDWNEWQANVVAAAILMPKRTVEQIMTHLAKGNRLKNYGGRFAYLDYSALRSFCSRMEVSQSAAVIRLRELGYLEDLPYSEYDDPTEVWA